MDSDNQSGQLYTKKIKKKSILQKSPQKKKLRLSNTCSSAKFIFKQKHADG